MIFSHYFVNSPNYGLIPSVSFLCVFKSLFGIRVKKTNESPIDAFKLKLLAETGLSLCR